jgi:hypothetical protein
MSIEEHLPSIRVGWRDVVPVCVMIMGLGAVFLSLEKRGYQKTHLLILFIFTKKIH